MERHEVEAQSDREIMVDVRLAVARLEVLTADVPELRERVTTVEIDVRWLKRIIYGTIPGTIALITLLGTWLKLGGSR